jgi:hypothetical protein
VGSYPQPRQADTPLTKALVPPFVERAQLIEFTKNGVAVTISLETDSLQQPLLRATFKPQHGFHLYSKDLDPKLTGGVGVATRVELLHSTLVRRRRSLHP